MECLGIRAALPSGRTECVPPRKPSFALSPSFLREAIRVGITNPAEGRALHARRGRHRLDRGMGPLGHRLIVNPPGGNGMPWFASGPYWRTRRPRPSDKNALRVIPELSPLGLQPGQGPRGGAGSARPQTGLCFHRWIAPLGHLLFALLSVIMTCLGLGTAAQCGRTECVPPRKPPPAHSRGLIPQGRIPSARPPRRGGLRTPAKAA